MGFLTDITSSTPEKYRFKLVSGVNYVICNPEPIDWKSGTLNIKRDLDAGGVFSSFQQDSLTFVGTGGEFLRKLYTAYEMNAKCTLIIYWWKSSIREYVEFPNQFDINFNFYEKVKVGKFAFGVRVKAINSSFQTKLDNRQDVDVDITKLVSIGGVPIVDYPAMKKLISYDATNIFYSADVLKVFTELLIAGNYLNHIKHQISYTALPLDITKNDGLAEIQAVSYQTNVVNIANIGSFFKTAKYDYDLDIDYYFVEHVSNAYHGTSFPWNLQILETKTSSDGTTEIVNTYDLGGFGGSNKTYTIQGTTSLTLTKGNDLKLVVQSPGIDATYRAYSMAQHLKIVNKVNASPESSSEGFPLYEATERVCQHMLDVQYPFYSEFFGREDVAYNESGDKYLSENQLRYAHIHSGMNLRGAKLGDTDYPLSLNFKNLFAAEKAIWNVGYMFQKISGSMRIRIEEYSFFFQNVLVIDFSSRINHYDIESVVMPELVPVDLKSGFDNYEYLSVNGRSEPNTTAQRTSIMNTATKWENISPLRGDTKGIYDNINNPIDTSGSTDTKGDSDAFIIKTQKLGSKMWKPEKGENIMIVNDSSLFREDLLNRYLTPSRMLLRHGNKLKAGLTKYLASSLTFQKSDKSNNLITSGEGYTIMESDDILVSNLATPIYKPMKHTITCEFTFSDLEAIQANPLGYFKFSDTVSGFLLSLKKKNNEDKAEISIIERYIS